VLVSRALSRVEGLDGRDASRVEARDELTGALDIVGVRRIDAGGRSGRAGLAGSGEITPSDSVTAGAAGAVGAIGADGAGPSCSEVIAAADWFCRTARYEPPAAAARHPTANPAKTSLLNSMLTFQQGACRAIPLKTWHFTPENSENCNFKCPLSPVVDSPTGP